MNFPKFKLVNSITKEVIGFEYLTIDGWKNDVFDFGERDGSFDQRELGDGFLGVVNRYQFIYSCDKDGKEIFDGDAVKAPSNTLFIVKWHEDEMRWAMMSQDTFYNMNCGILSVLSDN